MNRSSTAQSSHGPTSHEQPNPHAANMTELKQRELDRGEPPFPRKRNIKSSSMSISEFGSSGSDPPQFTTEPSARSELIHTSSMSWALPVKNGEGTQRARTAKRKSIQKSKNHEFAKYSQMRHFWQFLDFFDFWQKKHNHDIELTTMQLLAG